MQKQDWMLFHSIQVNVLLEYLNPVTVLLEYIDRYSWSFW